MIIIFIGGNYLLKGVDENMVVFLGEIGEVLVDGS